MTWLALPWFVLRTTGSPQRMTWVLIAEIVPIAVLGFWGGAIAARLGTRRTMLDLRPRARAAARRDPAAAVARAAAVPRAARARRRERRLHRAVLGRAARGRPGARRRGARRRRDRDRVLPGGEPADDLPRAAARRCPDRRHRRGERPLRRRGDATSSRSCSSLVFVHPPEVPAPEDERGVLAGVRFLLQRPAAAGLDAGVHAARRLLDALLRVAARARRDEVRRRTRTSSAGSSARSAAARSSARSSRSGSCAASSRWR